MNTGDRNRNPARPIADIRLEDLNGVLAASSDLVLELSRDGMVNTLLTDSRSPHHGALDGWQGHPLRQTLSSDSQHKLDDLLSRMATNDPLPPVIELNHRENGAGFPIRYTIHDVGSGKQVLMLGRDLQQIAETQQQLVQAQVALERGYEERREFDARYRMLLATTRDAIVFVSASDGRIRDLNTPAAKLLGGARDDLNGAPFAQEFKDRRRGEFVENLVSMAASEMSGDLSVVARRTQLAVRIVPAVFRAAGERILICRMEPEVEVPAIDNRLAADLISLYYGGTDGIIFTDTKGQIEEANDAFLEMIDVAHLSELRGRNLGQYLARGQIDMDGMLENAVRAGHIRFYSTRLSSDYGARTPVEISVVYLATRDRPALAFVVRDASRVEAVRSHLPLQTPDETTNSSVIELVGSAPLKDIVAETSDVIEKMCIQAAVELTRNNRAAAAEMLGLSRQSLYVKLRKYDLLTRNED